MPGLVCTVNIQLSSLLFWIRAVYCELCLYLRLKGEILQLDKR